MALGLLVTFGIADYVWQTPSIFHAILGNNYIFYSLLILQLATIFIFRSTYRNSGFLLAFLMYFTYSALAGLTLSVFFYIYQLNSVIYILSGTTFAFVCLSIFGYFTNIDLKSVGTFCLAGLCGLIGFYLSVILFRIFFDIYLTDINNILINIFGVIIFSGLTAYDVQVIKRKIPDQISLTESINYALLLYLDFLNLFLKLLQLFGKQR